MSRISNEETKRLLDHAIASSKRLTALKLAEELGVSAPRISEGRQAEWSLTEEQAEQLIEKYGQPRSRAGRFVVAEVADSIDGFLAKEPQRSSQRHLERLLKHVGAPDTRKRLASMLRPEGSGSSTSKVLEKFDDFLRSPPFQRWLDGAQRYVKKCLEAKVDSQDIHTYMCSTTYYNIEKIDRIPLPKAKINLPRKNSLQHAARDHDLEIEGMWGMDILLLGTLHQNLSDKRDFLDLGLNRPFTFNHAGEGFVSTETREFVITGDLIWKEEIFFHKPKIGKPALPSLFYPLDYNRPQSSFYLSLAPLGEPPVFDDYWDVDYWVTCQIMLLINDDCDYSLVLELGCQENVHLANHTIVIPKIPGLNLFKHLGRLRDWLELEELPELSIKTEIAARGGYIPGATVL